ncbi:MAG: hypothetical protein SCABRO_00084 [Candidatus Scalindua brodae]|uniref:AlgX/AlgJ SGNH hydrolase-like domain-containing protein n=1 Tax=Candidatus Scalindua brodae TaxID=237368 RepID=A0A0B0ESP0_9BACT|nr:MAG: hypothetical protein SCABRO_00084 [Candidatus Scalindua brodae]
MRLSVLEVAIRIFDPQSDLRRRDLFLRYEPFIGVEGIPNKKGIYATRSFKSTIELNNEGLRDYDHEKLNTQKKFRIIGLGDSFTFGNGVNNDQVFLKVLEKLNSGIETINMSIFGGNPQTSLKIYMSRGLKYEHNIAMLGIFLGSDLATYYPKDSDSPPQWGFDSEDNFVLIGKMLGQEEVEKIRKSSEDNYSPTKNRNLRKRINYWLVRHIQLLTFIGNYRNHFSNVIKGSSLYIKIFKTFGAENKGSYGFPNHCRKKDSTDMDYGWRLLSKSLETMRDYAGETGAELYVVLIPSQLQSSKILYERTLRKHGQDPSEFDLEKPNRKLAQLCESLEIACLDLLPAVKEAVSKGYQLYFIRDGHMNVHGNNFVAKEIYKDLKRRWPGQIESQ